MALQVKTVNDAQREALLVPVRPESAAQLVSAQATHRMHDPQDLVQLAQYVQTADNYTKSVVGGKLELISEQIMALQAQARRVLEDAKRDVELNHARCNFKRVPGTVYHLYRRHGDDDIHTATYFSMLSPAEWGERGTPDAFLGSYRLEYDMSWTPLKDVAARDARRQFDAGLLGVNGKDGTLLSLTLS